MWVRMRSTGAVSVVKGTIRVMFAIDRHAAAVVRRANVGCGSNTDPNPVGVVNESFVHEVRWDRPPSKTRSES